MAACGLLWGREAWPRAHPRTPLSLSARRRRRRQGGVRLGGRWRRGGVRRAARPGQAGVEWRRAFFTQEHLSRAWHACSVCVCCTPIRQPVRPHGHVASHGMACLCLDLLHVNVPHTTRACPHAREDGYASAHRFARVYRFPSCRASLLRLQRPLRLQRASGSHCLRRKCCRSNAIHRVA